MRKQIFFLGIISSLLLFSCNKEERFDDKKMIRNIVEQIILPEENQFYNDAMQLQKVTKEFKENTNKTNLVKVKEQWLVVAKSWARCYAFNIGNIKKKRFFTYFASFPANGSLLENIIKDVPAKELTKEYVLNKMGASTKGLYGLEYLLYKEDTEQTLTAFSKSESRKILLQRITDEFLNDAKNLKNAWEEYAPKFIANNKEKESIENSLNQIIGGLNNVIHYAWETKIGKPAGLGKKKYVQTNKIEAPYSKKSLELIKENVAITKKVYFNGGINKKVKFIMKSDLVNNAIKDRYNKINNAIKAFKAPLFKAVNTETKKVKTLYNELQLLEKKEFLTDLKSVFSFVELSTDGDGD